MYFPRKNQYYLYLAQSVQGFYVPDFQYHRFVNSGIG